MIVSVTNLYDKVSIKKSNTFINLCFFFLSCVIPKWIYSILLMITLQKVQQRIYHSLFCASDTCVIHLHVLSTLSWGEPGRTGGGRGTANGRRKGGKQDPCDSGERERNSKRQAFVICYCLHPVKETNPKTFLDFHLTFSEA